MAVQSLWSPFGVKRKKDDFFLEFRVERDTTVPAPNLTWLKWVRCATCQIHVCDGIRSYMWRGSCLRDPLTQKTYGVATVSRLLKIIGLFCKRALLNRRYSVKETYDYKEPTNRSHRIPAPAPPVTWLKYIMCVAWHICMCEMRYPLVRRRTSHVTICGATYTGATYTARRRMGDVFICGATSHESRIHMWWHIHKVSCHVFTYTSAHKSGIHMWCHIHKVPCHMCDATHTYVWHAHMNKCHVVSICGGTYTKYHVTYSHTQGITSQVFICDATYTRYRVICVTRLIHMCDATHSYVWHAHMNTSHVVFICGGTYIKYHVTYSHTQGIKSHIFICDATYTMSYVICVTRLIHMCDMHK